MISTCYLIFPLNASVSVTYARALLFVTIIEDRRNNGWCNSLVQRAIIVR